jgi:hypothetical protein
MSGQDPQHPLVGLEWTALDDADRGQVSGVR